MNYQTFYFQYRTFIFSLVVSIIKILDFCKKNIYAETSQTVTPHIPAKYSPIIVTCKASC